MGGSFAMENVELIVWVTSRDLENSAFNLALDIINPSN